jgi:(p)ppGpp synthase/HD superfamily hydrolase
MGRRPTLWDLDTTRSGADVILTERFTRAFDYCFELHRDHVRKGTRIPYVAHLMSVCALVLEEGGNEEEAIAALLHDALEDQSEKTDEMEISSRFGERVRKLVVSCSDTPPGHTGPKPPWRSRKG